MAYPAFVDEVSHANKKTERTKIIWGEGGHVYVYLIYGKYHQFAIVVNKANIPEVIFIRALLPDEGIEIMKENFGKDPQINKDLTKSPGNLCKAFGINLGLYGEDLTGDRIWIEDRGVNILPEEIQIGNRIGINNKLKGSDATNRYFIKQ